MADPKVLSVCVSCRFAQWKQTANGRRHPDGSGICGYEFPDTPLPKWARRTYQVKDATSTRELLNAVTGGRFIDWLEHHRNVAQPCATFEAKS